jgi:hypothetical protein
MTTNIESKKFTATAHKAKKEGGENKKNLHISLPSSFAANRRPVEPSVRGAIAVNFSSLFVITMSLFQYRSFGTATYYCHKRIPPTGSIEKNCPPPAFL